MEAIELMYYTITTALVIFIIAMIFVIYQLSLIFRAIRRFVWQLQTLPLFTKIAAGSIQAQLLTLVLKLFKRN